MQRSRRVATRQPLALTRAMPKDKNAAAVALGARGGRAGRGPAKRRGDADYYRRLVARRRDRSGMQHRHLSHDQFTLAAIDDIIGRGNLASWAALKRALAADPQLRSKVARICAAHDDDPFAQRYQFWAGYAARQAIA